MFMTASEPHGPQTENKPLIGTLSSSSSFSLSVRPVKTAGFYSCPSPSWIFTSKTGNLLLRPLCSAKHRVQLWCVLQPVLCSSHLCTEAVGHEQDLPPDLVLPVWGWIQFEHHTGRAALAASSQPLLGTPGGRCKFAKEQTQNQF